MEAEDLTGWRAPQPPGPMALSGRTVRLEPLAQDHAPALHAANGSGEALWRFLGYGPFADGAAYARWVAEVAGRPDPCFFTITPHGETPQGVASLMRIEPAHGCIEIGHVCFAPSLQRRVAATEAILLLALRALDAGYRRVEWKCDAANAPSRRAAARYGFAFEGVFRRHMIVKGRNRDTAWFALTAAEAPALRSAWRSWLAPENFDTQGRQRQTLGALTAPARAAAEADQRRLANPPP